MRRLGIVVGVFFAVVVVAGGLSNSTTAGTSIPACSTGASGTLVPVLQDFAVNQGLEAYTSTLVNGTSSGRLVRGKETLVRPYLTLPSSCSGSVALSSATLTAMIGGVSHSYTAYAGTGTGSLTASLTPNATVDPLFVVPAADLTPGDGSSTFTATWSVTLNFTQNKNATVISKAYNTIPIPTATTFEKKTNALRILVVPMGDASQAFSTQFPGAAQTDIQNAMSTLSRIYPVEAGIGDLSSTIGGIRYTIDLAAMVDLKAVSTYDGNNRFCGSQVNFDAIKAQLAQFLQSWNTQNPTATADRVVGAVYGGNAATTFGISDGGSFGCADGMAGVNSQVAWVRAIDDNAAARTPTYSFTGGVLAMEVAHTFGLVPSPRSSTFHSGNVIADVVAPTGRAYNVTSRSFIANSHSVMRYDTSTSPFDNTDTLLEAQDYNDLLCFLTPNAAANTECAAAAAGTTGSSVGVAAESTLVGSATTNPTSGATNFVETYYALGVAHSGACPGSPYHVLQLSGTAILANDPVCVETLTSDHGEDLDSPTRINNTSGVLSFAVSGVAGADTVELTKDGVADPLYVRHRQASAPSVSPVSTTRDFGPLSFTAPVVPPTPDILILADTTGSMGNALSSVKNGLTTPGTGIIPTILAQRPLAEFGAANYRDVDCDPATGYVLNQAITPTTTNVVTAVGNWQAPLGAGCDTPEDQLYALYQIATNPDAIGWRAGSSRIIVWFGDSSGHDPSPLSATNATQVTLGQVTNALVAAKIRVVAVPVNSAPDGDGLGNPASASGVNQAQYITEHTGGQLQPLTLAADVANAITAGLQNLPVTLGASTSCDNEGITLTLGSRRPVEDPIASGASVSYSDVVARIAPGTPAGAYTCTVSFTVNGTRDDGLTKTYPVIVPTTYSSGDLQFTAASPTPDNLRADVFYICGGAQYPVAVGLVPTQINGQQATFSAHFDSTIACGDSAGKLVAYVSDGIDRTAGQQSTPGAAPPGPNGPDAAIYAPFSPVYAPGAKAHFTGTGNSPQHGTLRGAALQWTFNGNPAGSGEAGDVTLPTTPGTYRLTLTATDGSLSDSDSRDLIVVAPPSLSITHAPAGATTTSSTVTFTVSAKDDASGLASVACSLDGAPATVPAPGGSSTPGASYTTTLTVTDYGTHTLQCTAAANDGLTASADDQSQVLYVFNGFLTPVDNPTIVNTGRVGKTYPVKWQLMNASGIYFSGLALVRSIKSKVVPCNTLSSASDPLETTASGGSVLRYDTTSNQYVYNWQTPSTAGCYEVDVSLNDDSVHTAYFKLS